MKQMKTALLGIAMIAGLISCKKETIGVGPVTTQTRDLQNFTAIELQMNGNVTYRTSPDWKVEISAKESIHSILETNVNGGTLVIRYRDGKTYDNDETIQIQIAGPAVRSFKTTTSGDIRVANTITQSNVYLGSLGAGNVYVQNVNANHIDAESKVSGTITVAGGTTATETLKSKASAKLDLSGVSAEQASARTEGSGDIFVKVSQKLTAAIIGSGSVYFSGSPAISSTISGSGRIIRY